LALRHLRARVQPEIHHMTAAHEAGARAAPCRPDWRLAARMLAQGEAVAAVARQVGCSRSQLSRRRNHDPLFRALIEELEQAEPPAEEGLAGLRHALHHAIEHEVRNGNVRVVLWLADRLSLVTPPGEHTTGQELQDILNGLSPAELNEFEGLRDPA
jgi:hypothetical protein